MVDFNNAFVSLANPVDTRVVLKVNGKSYNKWKSVNVNRGITQISGSFSFTTANDKEWDIIEGDECTVEVAGERVLTGYIDDIDDGYDENSHDITFTGRDKTADLVDCPYDVFSLNKTEIKSVGSFPSVPPAGEGEFKNLTALQIIEKLAASVNVEVELDSILALDAIATKKIPDYPIQTGRMLYEDIATLCQEYGVLPITNGYGVLFLTRAGLAIASDTLEVGVNIKANKLNRSMKDRYSVYYAEGPTKSTAFNASLIAEGKITDAYVKRTRPLIILVGEQATDDLCQKRAAWEARIRAGGSRKVGPTVVRGWTQKNGGIWPLNSIVQMKDDKINVQSKLLIANLSLSLDATGGELTSMGLVHPDTFILKEREPLKEKSDLNAFGRPL